MQELNTEAWTHRRKTMNPLHRAFVQRARRCPFRFAMADARVPRLSFGGALMKVVFLARRLRSDWAGQEMVGILLPPSVAGALVNFAALLAGQSAGEPQLHPLRGTARLLRPAVQAPDHPHLAGFSRPRQSENPLPHRCCWRKSLPNRASEKNCSR